jgi:hypothetical protein
VSTHPLLPLEEYAKRQFSEKSNELPERNADYWARYTHLLSGLREHVYPHVNAGLSCMSKSPGIYTDHGSDHFDEVVRYAGLLLGLPKSSDLGLTSYEIYLLLCGIRLHDAGNINGRENHETQVSSMLDAYGGNIKFDTAELRLISQIAEAHGGRTLSGDKDTIGQLPPDGTPISATTCRPRQVAALVRFADEICEHKSRAATHYITNSTLPDENKLFHYYAASIHGAAPTEDRCFKLRLMLEEKYLSEKYPLPSDEKGDRAEKYLVDDVLDRISKLDRERRYCNQFLDQRLQTTELSIEIEIIGAQTPPVNFPRTIRKYAFRIPSRSGYPADENSWRKGSDGLSGEKIAAMIKRGWHDK